MNRLLSLVLFGLLLTVLTGCPIGLDFPLGNPNQEKIESKLLGKWTIDDPEETIITASFVKKTENTYLITIHEHSELFSPETLFFHGWIVSLGGMRFLCTQEIANPSLYYHYVLIELGDSHLKLCDLSLLSDGIEAVQSTETLRSEVVASMNSPEFLNGALTYRKIKD